MQRVVQFPSGYPNVQVFFQVDGKSQILNFDTIELGLAALVATGGGRLVVYRNITLTANVTFPSNVTLDMDELGTITIPAGKVLTVNSDIIAENRLIFPGAGTITYGVNVLFQKPLWPSSTGLTVIQSFSSGSSGTTWLTGTVTPSSGAGSNGDFYLNTVTGDVYNKIAGAWVLVGNILGQDSYSLIYETTIKKEVDHFLGENTTLQANGFLGTGTGTLTSYGTPIGELSIQTAVTQFEDVVTSDVPDDGWANTAVVLSATPMRFKARLMTTGIGFSLLNKIVALGFTDALSLNLGAAGTGHGAFFRIEAVGSGVNIFAVCKNGTETTVDTGIADGSTRRTFEVVATSTSVLFYIDEVLKATISTNLPTQKLIGTIGTKSTAAPTKELRLDWVKYQSTRSNIA